MYYIFYFCTFCAAGQSRENNLTFCCRWCPAFPDENKLNNPWDKKNSVTPQEAIIRANRTNPNFMFLFCFWRSACGGIRVRSRSKFLGKECCHIALCGCSPLTHLHFVCPSAHHASFFISHSFKKYAKITIWLWWWSCHKFDDVPKRLYLSKLWIVVNRKFFGEEHNTLHTKIVVGFPLPEYGAYLGRKKAYGIMVQQMHLMSLTFSSEIALHQEKNMLWIQLNIFFLFTFSKLLQTASS